MTKRLIMFAPQESIGRNGEEQEATGSEDATKFIKGCQILIQVLEYVEGANKVH